ncbi:MAG: hypothetical protein ACO1Q7_13370 [Gemmatimonas sp.]
MTTIDEPQFVTIRAKCRECDSSRQLLQRVFARRNFGGFCNAEVFVAPSSCDGFARRVTRFLELHDYWKVPESTGNSIGNDRPLQCVSSVSSIRQIL